MNKTISTEMTRERLVSSVHSHVSLKVFIESETPFTLRAFERLLSRMNYYMPVEAFHVRKTHSTPMTCKTVLFQVNGLVGIKASFTCKLFSH